MLLKYETNRLILKVLGPDYAADVLRFYENDLELFEKYEMDRCQGFYTEGHQRTILNLEYSLCLKMQLVRFYVFLKEDPETIIGTVSLYEISKPLSKTEVGYKFSSAYHHQGYASEAVEKILDVAFTDLGLHRVCAHVHESNLPSIRLLENLGFEKEGICKAHMYMRGKWVDHLQYSLVTASTPEL
jgi:ribosomal-protein-alanine N-acetyltransferase